MKSLTQKIGEIIEEKSLLKHPFYQMWSDGELSIDSLAGYSKEYFQLVKAVPTFVDKVLEYCPDPEKEELRSNMKEESEHIKPWIRFAGAVGISEKELENYKGLQKTVEAVSTLSSLMNSLEVGAVAMYALEKEIPKISQTKLDGLKNFYGLTNQEATEYFELHKEADVRHAATWRKFLDKIPKEKHDSLIEFAKQSVLAQNLLLDSCYEAYC